MYLSRLILNPRSRAVQRDLANPYELHRTIMAAYPEDLPDRERVLFRTEVDPRTGVPTLLVQSVTAPDWSDLAARGDYLLPEPQWPPSVFANPATKTFDLALAAGQILAFRLRANPTVKREGSRHGLYKEEDQRAWLDRKGRRGGFEVRRLTVVQEGNTYAWIRRNGKTRKVTHFAVRFDGLLRVTEPEILSKTVAEGVGPAKGFGFGLLSLAPPP
ncbi:MAG: type I-E CRISPR-associated protein Cas6/Cse3/CasE [Anaerolineae bacterium]